MARSDMSDLEWEFIKAALPSEYGPPTTVYNRFNRWSYAGHWDRFMDAIADAHNVDMVMVDGTSVRAYHSATTLKKDPRRCLGRSRGGIGTKIHALTNQDGLPIRYELTPGQAHDAARQPPTWSTCARGQSI